MKNEVLFDYGDDGKIIAIEPEEQTYEVFAKAKLRGVPCSGGSMADEGPPIGSCGV